MTNDLTEAGLRNVIALARTDVADYESIVSLVAEVRSARERGGLIAEVRAEQAHGRQKYGLSPDDLTHDDAHTAGEWATFIKDHATRAADNTPMESRQHFVKVAGLALSAIEAIDRRIVQA